MQAARTDTLDGSVCNEDAEEGERGEDAEEGRDGEESEGEERRWDDAARDWVRGRPSRRLRSSHYVAQKFKGRRGPRRIERGHGITEEDDQCDAQGSQLENDWRFGSSVRVIKSGRRWGLTHEVYKRFRLVPECFYEYICVGLEGAVTRHSLREHLGRVYHEVSVTVIVWEEDTHSW